MLSGCWRGAEVQFASDCRCRAKSEGKFSGLRYGLGKRRGGGRNVATRQIALRVAHRAMTGGGMVRLGMLMGQEKPDDEYGKETARHGAPRAFTELSYREHFLH